MMSTRRAHESPKKPFWLVFSAALLLLSGLAVTTQAQKPEALPQAPVDVTPGSITYEDIPYPYPVSYLPLTVYGQDVRMAYMDVPPDGAQRPDGSPAARHELRRLLFQRTD